MQWAFQSSPHDTHDWDATQTPVLIDGEVNGQRRKLVAQASRNGFFFVLDRATGKTIFTSGFANQLGEGGGPDGRPIPNPERIRRSTAPSSRRTRVARRLAPADLQPVRACSMSATQGFSIWYIYDPSEKPQGWGGNDRGG